jgi:hypothetical protein
MHTLLVEVRGMKNKNLIITVVACLVVGAAAFFGGMQYQKMQRNAQFANFAANGQRTGGRFGGAGANGGQNGGNFRPVIGQITSNDGSTLTVKMQDGSSKIVVLSGSTNIMQSTSATKDQLISGQDGYGHNQFRWVCDSSKYYFKPNV